jgi:CHAD domain-containing protein
MAINGTNGHKLGQGRGHYTRLLFNRIRRHAGALKGARHADVHKFRTNSRRVEAIVGEFVPDSRSKRKLLKQLSRLRKKAGKIRDLDVQIAFLKDLKVPDRGGHRVALIEWLSDERARRAKKLARLFDADTRSDLRKRLRRAESEIDINRTDPLQLAYQRLPHPGHAALNERTLHVCRIEAKRARYLAELADNPAAKNFVQELKRAQDQVGEWHDVLKLKEIAEHRYGGVHNSPLVAALQNIARARFRRAVTSLLTALSTLGAQRSGFETQKTRKTPASDVPANAAAA